MLEKNFFNISNFSSTGALVTSLNEIEKDSYKSYLKNNPITTWNPYKAFRQNTLIKLEAIQYSKERALISAYNFIKNQDSNSENIDSNIIADKVAQAVQSKSKTDYFKNSRLGRSNSMLRFIGMASLATGMGLGIASYALAIAGTAAATGLTLVAPPLPLLIVTGIVLGAGFSCLAAHAIIERKAEIKSKLDGKEARVNFMEPIKSQKKSKAISSNEVLENSLEKIVNKIYQAEFATSLKKETSEYLRKHDQPLKIHNHAFLEYIPFDKATPPQLESFNALSEAANKKPGVDISKTLAEANKAPQTPAQNALQNPPKAGVSKT